MRDLRIKAYLIKYASFIMIAANLITAISICISAIIKVKYTVIHYRNRNRKMGFFPR